MRPYFVFTAACERHFSGQAMLSSDENVGLCGLRGWNLNTGNDGIIVAWLTM
jgi:hypothetical protein